MRLAVLQKIATSTQSSVLDLCDVPLQFILLRCLARTPLVCKPCVLGETYSSEYEAGACKDCENCGQYRETTKKCTLTSKAECGKCKLGAYAEPMLGMCKPCSPCCNDGNDIVVPECKVPGLPTNMQCSFARSEKCSKVIASTTGSTTASTLPTRKQRNESQRQRQDNSTNNQANANPPSQ
ncbi:hypothetical protein ACROYT_G018236 [Oculina patagonica]